MIKVVVTKIYLFSLSSLENSKCKHKANATAPRKPGKKEVHIKSIQ